MGDMGMDRWIEKMDEHRRKGHQVIMPDERTVNEIEQACLQQDILLKEQRTNFWEKHHRVPTTNDLILRGVEI